MFNPAQDWPVYIFLAIFFGAVIYGVILSKKNERIEKEKQKKNSDKYPI